jgi:tRNA-Thr(GGU) m(6)t(6)A37 methyltransferase TsaA
VPFLFEPIGFVHSPFVERADAPRQAVADGGLGAEGRIELLAGHGYEDALEGLEGFGHVWVLFVFHRNVDQDRGWSPKVLPPRAERKVGLFATRSPHRPNPIGMSAVAIDRVEGLSVHVRNLDILDGTPVLDLKPYVPIPDAYPGSPVGWLAERDPRAPWEVVFSSRAEEQAAWLASHGVALRAAVAKALALGPQPHAYRRIRRRGDAFELAWKEWRVAFAVEGERRIAVHGVASGFRPKERETRPELELHRAFAARFAAG